MRVLEELWYGNLEPMGYGTDVSKEYKDALELVSRNAEKLRATLTEEQKELFARYIDSVQESRSIAECLLFQHSFRLAARMMAEVMVG